MGDRIRVGRIAEGEGFTLIELVVVLSIVAAVSFIALPKFTTSPLRDDSRNAANWILQNVASLKAKAVIENTPLVLHIGIDTGRFWITDASFDSQETAPKQLGGFTLPDTVRIADVQRPGLEKQTAGQLSLRFFPAGYNDRALIHLRDDRGTYRSFRIEAFLPRVTYSEGYLDIEGG
ncbi:MAG: prepilin-type N-terminal cleavage/methylation domain-containing protein [Desulfobacteraceae bacterium]|nr:prepilin-type N-terminal cleavage/methylation domain-containing protein [Desulfobacteraceae bacterium]